MQLDSAPHADRLQSFRSDRLVSGIYVAKLLSSTGYDRYILSAVRDDGPPSGPPL